tara:strand:+ start:2129 stop:2497 length:369 start_codon:yes stop_codon:yes gene_type:complete
MSNIVNAFNEHFTELVEDIILIFPHDNDLKMASNALSLIILATPKLVINTFKQKVVNPYREQIDAGDISFFIEKDYSNDLQGKDNILDKINVLRDPIRKMDNINKEKTIKYIQNLSKLCDLH